MCFMRTIVTVILPSFNCLMIDAVLFFTPFQKVNIDRVFLLLFSKSIKKVGAFFKAFENCSVVVFM